MVGLRRFSVRNTGVFSCALPILRLADEDDPFLLAELAQMLGHHLVLALALAELHERNLMLRHEAFQRCHEASAHRAHQGGGRQRLPAMLPEEPHDPPFVLQQRDENVEVHPVDPFDRKFHMTVENVGHVLCYHDPGSGRAVMPLEGV